MKKIVLIIIMQMLLFGKTIYAEEVNIQYMDFGIGMFSNCIQITLTDYSINEKVYTLDEHLIENIINDLNEFSYIPCINEKIENQKYDKYIKVQLGGGGAIVITNCGCCYLTDYYGYRYENPSAQSVISKVENVEKLKKYFNEIKSKYDFTNQTFDSDNVSLPLKRREVISMIANGIERLTAIQPNVIYDPSPFMDNISEFGEHYNDIVCCYECGIICGTQGKDTNILVEPLKCIEYEQVIALMARFHKFFYENTDMPYEFKEQIDIDDSLLMSYSEWAREDIKYLMNRELLDANDLTHNDYGKVTRKAVLKIYNAIYEDLSMYINPQMFNVEQYKENNINNWFDYIRTRADKGTVRKSVSRGRFS